MCFKDSCRSKWAVVTSQKMIEQTPYSVEKVKNNKSTKMTHRDVFSPSYLAIFPATL